MNVTNHFILVDDDEINNMIASMIIKKATENPAIRSFVCPFEGLEYIEREFANTGEATTATLFLDLSMPMMDGWEFLDKFDKLAPDVRSRIRVNLLSSSDDRRDVVRAGQNRNVSRYLVKPLTIDLIREAIAAA